MNPLLEKTYLLLPDVAQNLAISVFDLQYYRKRGGPYPRLLAEYKALYEAPLEAHLAVQRERLAAFLRYVRERSPYYRERWAGVDVDRIRAPEELRALPEISKEELRQNIDRVATVRPGEGFAGHTGGTTGKSLTTYYTWGDVQDSMALLDSFRERHGWRLGSRTAWFSGKNILSPRDVAKGRFWKTDYWFRIRYYSTFHLAERHLGRYVEDLNRFRPEYLSGFPSSIHEIAAYARRTGHKLTCRPRAAFTTAETLVPEQVRTIEEEFHTLVLDQYASSEGAPVIVQCEHKAMHFLPASGVIEVVDERGEPAEEGEILVTSFATRGTPLVRYRIGDRMRIRPSTGERCACGCCAPVVDAIHGRVNDFLFSPERGKINLGNVSNCVKYAHGVVAFQAVQDEPTRVVVNLAVDPSVYGQEDEASIRQEFARRLGDGVALAFVYVDEIPREPSGKHRIVKNSLRVP